MIVKYSSNNSGGGWWLKDKDWENLENSGWDVKWEDWLGAKAMECSKDFDNIRDALFEFEKITGQDVSDNGCNCCGPPHSFNWKENGEYHYCSGSQCLNYMYNNVPNSIRDACY